VVFLFGYRLDRSMLSDSRIPFSGCDTIGSPQPLDEAQVEDAEVGEGYSLLLAAAVTSN
jgi:hypothetical protein